MLDKKLFLVLMWVFVHKVQVLKLNLPNILSKAHYFMQINLSIHSKQNVLHLEALISLKLKLTSNTAVCNI